MLIMNHDQCPLQVKTVNKSSWRKEGKISRKGLREEVTTEKDRLETTKLSIVCLWFGLLYTCQSISQAKSGFANVSNVYPHNHSIAASFGSSCEYTTCTAVQDAEVHVCNVNKAFHGNGYSPTIINQI